MGTVPVAIGTSKSHSIGFRFHRHQWEPGMWPVCKVQLKLVRFFPKWCYHSKWTFSGSWLFVSLHSTMKFCSACILDHYTCIITFNPNIGLLLLAVLFLGFLSVYSLCCKKKGIGLPPILLAKIIWREVQWAETKFKVFLPYMRTKLRIVGQNQKQIPCINQKQ